MEPWRIQFRDPIYRLGVDLLIWRRAPNGKVEVYHPDGAEEIVDVGVDVKPSFYLDEEMLIGLADALQARGVRPKEAGKTEGLYEAQSKHLEDLRTLLFNPKKDGK